MTVNNDDLLDDYIPTQKEVAALGFDEDEAKKLIKTHFLPALTSYKVTSKVAQIGGYRSSLSLDEYKLMVPLLRKRGWRVHANYQLKAIEDWPRLLVFPRGFWGGVQYYLFRWFV